MKKKEEKWKEVKKERREKEEKEEVILPSIWLIKEAIATNNNKIQNFNISLILFCLFVGVVIVAKRFFETSQLKKESKECHKKVQQLVDYKSYIVRWMR